MENGNKFFIILAIVLFGFTIYNGIKYGISGRDIELELGKDIGILAVLYLGYSATKKEDKRVYIPPVQNIKKVEDNQPKQ